MSKPAGKPAQEHIKLLWAPSNSAPSLRFLNLTVYFSPLPLHYLCASHSLPLTPTHSQSTSCSVSQNSKGVTAMCRPVVVLLAISVEKSLMNKVSSLHLSVPSHSSSYSISTHTSFFLSLPYTHVHIHTHTERQTDTQTDRDTHTQIHMACCLISQNPA